MTENCCDCRFCVILDDHRSACQRYPKAEALPQSQWCGEWSPVAASDEILNSAVDSLEIGSHTRLVCQRLRLQVVKDVVDLGRANIRTNGCLDRYAIDDLEKALKKVGVRW